MSTQLDTQAASSSLMSRMEVEALLAQARAELAEIFEEEAAADAAYREVASRVRRPRRGETPRKAFETAMGRYRQADLFDWRRNGPTARNSKKAEAREQARSSSATDRDSGDLRSPMRLADLDPTMRQWERQPSDVRLERDAKAESEVAAIAARVDTSERVETLEVHHPEIPEFFVVELYEMGYQVISLCFDDEDTGERRVMDHWVREIEAHRGGDLVDVVRKFLHFRLDVAARRDEPVALGRAEEAQA